MSVEKPPIADVNLSSYLMRVLTALQSSIESCKTFLVTTYIKNPLKGKLYLVDTANSQFDSAGLYYFNGTDFIKVTDGSSKTLSLGIAHTDAYYGDFGKAAYDHSKAIGNPHGLTTKDLGLDLVNNTSDKGKPLSDAAKLAFVPVSRKVNLHALSADIVLSTDDIDPTYSRRYITAGQLDLVTIAASASTNGYLLAADWTTFNNKQNALGFTPENITNKVITWSSPTNSQYPSAKLVNDTFALYVTTASYHQFFKGLFGTLTALNAALPTAIAGDYAQVDAGVGASPQTYFWDASDNIWVLNSSSGSGATNTDGLPEGSFNFYFTENRVRSTLLTGFVASAGTVGATDSIVVAFNKVVGNFNSPGAHPTLNQNTTGSAAKLTTARTIDGISFDGTANITTIAEATHAATSKTTPVDADEFSLVDSAASFVLKKLSFLNLKLAVSSWCNPVGTIREFNVSTNPGTLLGFGTWAAFGTGRVTVAIDTGQTEFDTLGKTGGEKTHLLTSAESGLPAHSHPTSNSGTLLGSGAGTGAGLVTSGVAYSSGITIAANTAANASAAHNNLQPYIVVYKWVRTA